MIAKMNEKLLNDEVLSDDPVLISLAPQFGNLGEIVKNEIESEVKRIDVLLKKNLLMDEKDAGTDFLK